MSREAARRCLLARQGLLAVPGGPRPWRAALRGAAGALTAIRRLQCIQVDPMAVVARNHQLVLQSRVGRYRPADLDELFARRQVFEFYANALCIFPIEDFPQLWPAMLQVRANQAREREKLGPVLAGVLEHLHRHGATPSRDLGRDGPRLYNIGWDNTGQGSKASNHAIALLWQAGEIMVARRDDGEKWWDLTERVLPPAIAAALPVLPAPVAGGPARVWSAPPPVHAELQEWLADRYMAGFGLFDAGDFRWGWQHRPAAQRRAALAARVARGQVISLQIAGVKRQYYLLAAEAEALAAAARWQPEPLISFLPPLDNLLWRRERLADLFEFEYTWEAYTPVHKRRWGAYTLPILEGDRLIGRLSPRLDRKTGVLVIDGLWLEPWAKADAHRRRRLGRALCAFSQWHGAGGGGGGRPPPRRGGGGWGAWPGGAGGGGGPPPPPPPGGDGPVGVAGAIWLFTRRAGSVIMAPCLFTGR